MALVLADRVKETTTTTGTGTVTLLGATTGFQSFAAVGDGNTTYYTIAGQTGSEWEVGIGTYTSSGTTLARTTVLSSSNSGSLVNFSAGTKDVFVTYPSSRSVYANGTTLTASNSSVLPVTSGGTGVTASSGASSVVLRDANGNTSINSVSEGFVNVAAAGTTTTLTASSAPNYCVTGSGGQTFRLPDATTLVAGSNYFFNNNQSSGTIVVQNSSGTTIATIQSGGYVEIMLLVASPAAGSWDTHNYAPSNVSWSTNTFDYAGSITSATWNGATVQVNRGGTGLATTTAYSVVFTGTTATGAFQASAGPGTAGYILTSNGAGALPTFQASTAASKSYAQAMRILGLG